MASSIMCTDPADRLYASVAWLSTCSDSRVYYTKLRVWSMSRIEDKLNLEAIVEPEGNFTISGTIYHTRIVAVRMYVHV